jgi:hypothetical protein
MMLSPLDCPVGSFYINITGLASAFPTGYVPHGNPHLAGEGVFTFHDDSSMDWKMHLAPSSHHNKYEVTQAHLYNLPKVPAGDSWACWGGRWSPHEFMEGTNFGTLYGITADDIRKDTWVIMLHTEGGHFALDGTGQQLVKYNQKIHETSVTGITEKGERFNNRVPRKLTNRILREVNPVSGQRGDKAFDADYPDPNHFERTQDEPFPDANDNVWIAWDEATERYIPSPYGASRNLTINDIDNVEYLFYLYDDQGPEWDYGGPEGAGGGVLIPCSERPVHHHTTSAAQTSGPTASPMVAMASVPTTAAAAPPPTSPVVVVADPVSATTTNATTIASRDASSIAAPAAASAAGHVAAVYLSCCFLGLVLVTVSLVPC